TAHGYARPPASAPAIARTRRGLRAASIARRECRSRRSHGDRVRARRRRRTAFQAGRVDSSRRAIGGMRRILSESPPCPQPPRPPPPSPAALDPIAVAASIRAWGAELGFQQIAITDIHTGAHALHLQDWLAKNFHGEMAYMAAHGTKRWQPDELEPGTCRVI